MLICTNLNVNTVCRNVGCPLSTLHRQNRKNRGTVHTTVPAGLNSGPLGNYVNLFESKNYKYVLILSPLIDNCTSEVAAPVKSRFTPKALFAWD